LEVLLKYSNPRRRTGDVIAMFEVLLRYSNSCAGTGYVVAVLEMLFRLFGSCDGTKDIAAILGLPFGMFERGQRQSRHRHPLNNNNTRSRWLAINKT
jgi:hypothetical protein